MNILRLSWETTWLSEVTTVTESVQLLISALLICKQNITWGLVLNTGSTNKKYTHFNERKLYVL